MALVASITKEHDLEPKQFGVFFNETFDVISLFDCPNSWNNSKRAILEDDAITLLNQYLGKHGYKINIHV